MSYSVRNIAIALVLAVAAAALVITYTGRVEQQATDSQTRTPVVVAVKEVPAGTSVAEALADGAFDVKNVVRGDKVPTAFAGTGQLNAELVTRTVIVPGQQVSGALFGESSSVRIPERIGATTRALQIALDENAVLFGTLQPGDRVDLVGTYKVLPEDNGAERYVSRIIARDVEVLGPTPEEVAAESTGAGANAQTRSVTLAVADTLVPKVNFTLGGGTLWLVARPATGAEDGATTVADLCSVVADGLNQQQITSYIPECAGRAA